MQYGSCIIEISQLYYLVCEIPAEASFTLSNVGNQTAYIGADPSVTTVNGYPIPKDCTYIISYTKSPVVIYAIGSKPGADLRWIVAQEGTMGCKPDVEWMRRMLEAGCAAEIDSQQIEEALDYIDYLETKIQQGGGSGSEAEQSGE